MDALFFIVKYIPFWAVAIIFIAGPFGYLFWIKDIPKLVYLCLFLCFVSFVSVIYWIWAGGPQKSVDFLIQTMQSM